MQVMKRVEETKKMCKLQSIASLTKKPRHKTKRKKDLPNKVKSLEKLNISRKPFEIIETQKYDKKPNKKDVKDEVMVNTIDINTKRDSCLTSVYENMSGDSHGGDRISIRPDLNNLECFKCPTVCDFI
jgi:hypothetical protein